MLFAKDAFNLTSKASSVIAAAVQEIKADKAGTALTVTGHTDSDGSDAVNLTLSKKRADSVAAALKQALGGSYTITTAGKGEAEPIASNDSDAGKAKNRRVTITYTGGR